MFAFAQAFLVACRLCGTLAISVVDQSGAPLPGATIQFEEFGVATRLEFTDVSGKVTIFPLPSGVTRFRVRLDGYQDHWVTTRVEKHERTLEQILLKANEIPRTPFSLSGSHAPN